MTLHKDDLAHHISGQYNEDLANLHNHVLNMGRLVVKQIQDALVALQHADADLVAQVTVGDFRVNAEEVSIDEECTRILVRRQPAASDLRLIFSVIKAVTDLERAGDLAERIAVTALETPGGAPGTMRSPVIHLGEMVVASLARAIDCFATMDSDLAFNIVDEDKEVDQEFRAVMRQLLTYMMEDPRTISWAMQLSWAARAMERIGDHAKNIAEYVIYMVHGADVRHTSAEEQARIRYRVEGE
jgi:phosphate transport system protein